MDDFERQLNEIHDRVLGKALTESKKSYNPKQATFVIFIPWWSSL